MRLSTKYLLELGEESSFYYELLKEEDFNFKTKSIIVEVYQQNTLVEVVVRADSIHELKIGISAVMKSLEVISKTLNIDK